MRNLITPSGEATQSYLGISPGQSGGGDTDTGQRTISSRRGRWRTAIRLSMIFGGATALGLSACAGPNVDEQPAQSELPPIEQPVLQAGTTVHQIDARTGQERSWTILEVSEGIVKAQNSEGCAWTTRAEWFPPSLSWDNCGSNRDWNKGVVTIAEESGQMWPLQVGNTATYEYSSESLVTGEKNSAVRTCEVEGTVRISVAAGEVDAYKVVCTDQRRGSQTVRTWYWTPDLGEVKFTNWHSRRGVEADVDTVRTESPRAS